MLYRLHFTIYFVLSIIHLTLWEKNVYSKIITFKSTSFENGYSICVFSKNKIIHRGNDLPALLVYFSNKGVLQLHKREWFFEGEKQREGDKPAEIKEDNFLGVGYKMWYKFGKIHRDNDLPAVEHSNGSKQWFCKGRRHRDGDLHAVELYSPFFDTHSDIGLNYCVMPKLSTKIWYRYGQKHRPNDLPALERSNGDKEWWDYGSLHRDNDKPASISKNYQEWYKNGARHRENGPSIIETKKRFFSYFRSRHWYEKGNRTKIIDNFSILGIPLFTTFSFENGENGFCEEIFLFIMSFQTYKKNGFLHRENNLPASCFKIFGISLFKDFYENGKLYVKEKIENQTFKHFKESGEYILNSFNDKPSKVYQNGTKEWHKDNILHREDDKPAVVYQNGDCEWWIEGKRHRIGGPAVVYKNVQCWYVDGDFLNV